MNGNLSSGTKTPKTNKQTNKQFNTFIKSEKSTNQNIYRNTHFKISETLVELENKALEASSIFNKLLCLENYIKKTISFFQNQASQYSSIFIK